METFKLSKRCGFVVVKLTASQEAQMEGRARCVVWLPREEWSPNRLEVHVLDAKLDAGADEGYLVDRLELTPDEVDRARRVSSGVTWSPEEISVRLRWLHDKMSSFQCYATNHLMPRTRNPKPPQYLIDYYWDRVRACREEQRELLSHLPEGLAATLRESLLIP